MLVVWEPILPSDWGPPGRAAMRRIPDSRVQQFWDPNHMVASALNEVAKQKPPQPDPECCVKKGFYWDEAILYPAVARWANLPTAGFWNGPVYHVIPGLEDAITHQAILHSGN